MRSALLCLGSVLTLVVASARAPARPRIGLALSGGGTRGLAHIGVLEWLEAHHIPVDYIAGTSMGGLIAGMYAMGISPAEMRATIRNVNWNDAFLGRPPYRDLTFRRKEDRHDFPGGLQLGLKHGVSLPPGLDPAEPIDLLLSQTALRCSALPSFDDLPIPFRCIAVDLKSGESVAMHNGSLAQALRATMAIPGVFTPVERNGRVLVDGGILQNLPTQAVKNMGADVIIAVDLTPSVTHGADLKSLFGLLDQTVTVVLLNNVRRSLELADIVIVPDMRGMEDLPYTAVDAYANRGEQIAPKKAKMLEQYALSDADWQRYLAARQARMPKPVPVPAFVEVTGVGDRHAREVERYLRDFVGKPLDTRRLDARLTALTGDGRYDSTIYELARRDAEEGLRVRVHAKPYAPPFFDVAVNVNGAETEDVTFGVGTRITAMDTVGPRSEWRTDFDLGTHTRLATELYRPLGFSRLFLAPHITYDANTFDVFQSGTRLAQYRVDQVGIGMDLGVDLGRLSELRVGFDEGHLHAGVRTGAPVLPRVVGETRALTSRWILDTLDTPGVPSSGVRAEVSGRWMLEVPGADGRVKQADARIEAFKPVTRRDTAMLLASAGTSFGTPAPAPLQFTLGGPLRLSAYSPGELRGNDYAYVGVGALHRIATLPPYLGGGVDVGATYELGGAFDRFSDGRYATDVALGIVAETTVGPIYVGGAVGDAGHHKIFFSIGRLF